MEININPLKPLPDINNGIDTLETQNTPNLQNGGIDFIMMCEETIKDLSEKDKIEENVVDNNCFQKVDDEIIYDEECVRKTINEIEFCKENIIEIKDEGREHDIIISHLFEIYIKSQYWLYLTNLKKGIICSTSEERKKYIPPFNIAIENIGLLNDNYLRTKKKEWNGKIRIEEIIEDDLKKY